MTGRAGRKRRGACLGAWSERGSRTGWGQSKGPPPQAQSHSTGSLPCQVVQGDPEGSSRLGLGSWAGKMRMPVGTSLVWGPQERVARTPGEPRRNSWAFSQKKEPGQSLCVPSLRSPWAAGSSPGSQHFVALAGRVGALEPSHQGGLGRGGVAHSLRSLGAHCPPPGTVSSRKGSGEQTGCSHVPVGSVSGPPAEPAQPGPGP